MTLGRHDGGALGSHQQALQAALAALREDAARVASASPAAGALIEEEPTDDVAPTAPLDGDDDLVMRHLAFFGSFVTRRLDELDRRIDELADSLVLLQTSLARFPVAHLRGGTARAAGPASAPGRVDPTPDRPGSSRVPGPDRHRSRWRRAERGS